MATAKAENSGGVSRTEKGDSTVRIWRSRTASKQNRKEREKGRHLTRKLMNTSAGVEEVGGGRKSRRCVAAGEENDDMDVDFVADWMRACVEELQRLTAKLEVVSDWRVVAGDDGASVMGAGVSELFV
jgi:hypothetical protein